MNAYFNENPESLSPNQIRSLSPKLFNKRKISSTNVLERVFKEIRRHTRVVIGIFPNQEWYIRLVTCCLIEESDDWVTDRSHILEERILSLKECLEAVME